MIGKIGRVCVLAPYRGRGHAKALMGMPQSFKGR